MAILTISQLNRYVAYRLKEDKAIQSILVRGEISNFTCHTRSGHCYFTLKDEECAVRAVMFRSAAQQIRFRPKDGMHIIAAASANLYERDGSFQLYVTDMQEDGIGAQQLALQKLKEKLTTMGVFDPSAKRSLPMYPKKIGVVTSGSGAAVHDIMDVTGRRYPIGELAIFPAQVQGEAAPASIAMAIRRAEAAGCDVLIVGRGGGSAEDLSAFNTEQVVMAVYNCTVPVISAVGHETDVTLTDAAADLRAPTPSAAAELAVPSVQEMQKLLESKTSKMTSAFEGILQQKTAFLERLTHRVKACSPEQRQLLAEKELQNLKNRLERSIKAKITTSENLMQREVLRLDALSPLKILSRGYSLVYKDDALLRTSEDAKENDELRVVLGRGELYVKVLNRKDDDKDDI